MRYDLGIEDGQCTFKIEELRDPDTKKRVTIGGHGCKEYGLNLQIYLRTADWEEKVEKQFHYEDPTTGEVRANTQLSCKKGARSLFVRCVFYLAPDNNRMGWLSREDAGMILSYRARWVHKR